MTQRVDAHHHFWKYSDAEYAWIGDEMRVLRRDFLPSELNSEMASTGIRAAIAVQARQSLKETKWLLRIAHHYPFIAGVIGWAPIDSIGFPECIKSLASDPKLKGLRHVLQDEPDDAYMLRDNFLVGISALQGLELVYDLLIRKEQLPYAIKLVDFYPDQLFVLNHLAKPKIRARELLPWREHLQELAQRPNVYCKLSGMVTEANWKQWRVNDLRPYVDAALRSFGSQRLLAGSDWPVCTVACSYKRWWDTLRELLFDLPLQEQEGILGGNATRVYQLEDNT